MAINVPAWMVFRHWTGTGAVAQRLWSYKDVDDHTIVTYVEGESKAKFHNNFEATAAQLRALADMIDSA